jgi:ATP-dependent protease Clp ATPase subunit
MDEVEFSITDEALDFIVGKALEYKLGARGLRSLCEAVLTDAMYDQVQKIKKLEIDEAYANEALNKNLLKRLEMLQNYRFLKQQPVHSIERVFLMGKLNYLLLFEK